MKCPRCKKQLRKGAKFCPACGTKVEKRKVRPSLILWIIILLLSLIVIGWSGGILFAKYFGGNFRNLFSEKEKVETHNVGEVFAKAEEAIAHAKKLGLEGGYENDVTEAYLQSVTNEIIELDIDNGVATVEVSVPNLTEFLPQAVTNVLKSNEGTPYEELLQIVQSEVKNVLSNEEFEIITTTIDLPVKEINSEYKPVYNEQWEVIVFGGLEDMYLEYYRTMIGEISDEIPE